MKNLPYCPCKGFASLLSALLLPCLGLTQDTEGKLSIVVGDVQIVQPDGQAVKANRGATVTSGATVKTGADSRAILVATKQSAVRIGENSELLVEELEDSNEKPKVLLDLKNGSLGALIKPQAQSVMDFRIKTPSGVAAARGTFYSVAVEDGKKGFVQVKEGKVVVTPNKPKEEAAKPGSVSQMEGSLTLLTKEGEEKALQKGDEVPLGSTLKTGENSSAIIRITTDSAINMTANTETVVEEVDNSEEKPKVLLDLKNGTMSALINPKVKGMMDFRIKTPSGVAAARGTFYSVAVENGRGYVNVKEGEVKVIPLGEETDEEEGADDPANEEEADNQADAPPAQ